MNRVVPIALLLLSVSACARNAAEVSPPGATNARAREFSSPEEAEAALVKGVAAHDRKELISIFGPESEGMLQTGDEVADKEAFDEFATALAAKHSLEKLDEESYVILVGEKEWPFPIPLVKEGGAWVYDTELGKEEIIDRRIGENELRTIRTCRSYVQAQREYKGKDRDGDGVREYAQRAVSSAGKKDGLYWPASDKDEQSPFGPLAAEAAQEGYRKKGEAPMPFHGYFFKILTAQGPDAAGGAKSYLDKKGNMTKGFALLAYPTKWNSSGVMSFAVNQEGIVYEKDLGVQTLATAEEMTAFDPGAGWEPVADADEDAVEVD